MSAPTTVAKSLDSEVQFLKGVGPELAKKLSKLGLRTIADVLRYYPRRYEDRSNLPPISKVRPGQFVTVRGRIQSVEGRPTRGGKVILKAMLGDGTGMMHLVWFNQPWIKRKLESHHGEVIAYGMAKESGWTIELSSPEFELIGEDDDAEAFARIVPIYALVEGVTQKMVRKAVRSALEHFLPSVQEPFPPDFLKQHMLRPIRWSLRQIHEPESEEFRQQARRRLVFEEFFGLQLALALRRAETEQEMGISFPITKLAGSIVEPGTLFVSENIGVARGETLWDEVHRMLPFDLTGAQRRVIGEIWRDMERPHPMNRLVQGDVGSGKTAVAACAILAAVRCGYQAAMMAPTEILAEQHYVNLHRLFEPLGIRMTLLVGKQGAKERKRSLDLVQSGGAQVVVGTHAVIQEGVQFPKLGLAIIDEQHRFGVLQRAALRQKGIGNPDVLVMTATPIPRTLTMTLYGDLDVSVIDEMPPGRRAIKTHWKRGHERESVYSGVRTIVESGRQAYVVCPMISESEKMQTQAAVDLHYRLSNEDFADLRVGLLHGQMKPKDKEEIMEQFRSHEIDVLVSTVVIEVGVDVANATVMVIEDAFRFGLSQLHQLRGRVGRGAEQSFCILISDAKTDEAAERLGVIESTVDGFRIAEEDLRIRGPGEMIGTRQSGNLDFAIGDLISDARTLEEAREAAIDLLKRDPDLADPSHALMLQRAQDKRAEEAIVVIS